MNSQQMDFQTIVEDASKSSPPSLKNLCAMRCASEFFNLKEVRELLKCIEGPTKFNLEIKLGKKWQKINEIIIDRLNSMRIPKTVKDKILSYSFPIGLEIMKWIELHPGCELPEEFCWTVKGTIDNKNTAKRIIRNNSMCIVKRFTLSCLYCLDTDIILLWMGFSLRDKDYYINNVRNPIIFYWVVTMCAPREKALLFDYDLVFQEAFDYTVDNGYLDAVKYFTNKLYITRQTFLTEIFNRIVRKKPFNIPEVQEVDTWFFLFSHMTTELQLKYFQNQDSLSVIYHMFACSGRQKYIIMLMNLARPHMHIYHYLEIGVLIMERYLLEYKDCNYRKMFIQFWHQIPNSEEKFLKIKRKLGVSLFANLIQFYFKFLLEKGTLKRKGELISRYLKSNELKSDCCFVRDNWKFLLSLIEHKIVTCRDIKRYKRRFLRTFNIRVEDELILKRTLHLIRKITSKKL